jgi:hypothetical protein
MILERLCTDGRELTDDLQELSELLDIASVVCRRAKQIHDGGFVPYDKMCAELGLTGSMKEMLVEQDILETIVHPVGVSIVKQAAPKRGGAWPNFVSEH